MTDLKGQVPLQAIVFGDCYSNDFAPASYEKSKVLVDLAGSPVLNYTIEFLRKNEVEEIFVIASQYIDEIEAFIQQWNERYKTNVVKIVKATNVSSPGEALREVDSLGIIRSDPFVLCFGDTVANVDLSSAINQHKIRRKKDKNCILTSLFVQTSEYQQKRSLRDGLTVIFDTTSKRIVKYDLNTSADSVYFEFGDNEEVFLEHPSLEVRSDLVDCEVDICSPEMLLEIAGNYDYQDLRKDYIRNEVLNRDLGYSIYLQEISSTSYCQRVKDYRSYFYSSIDVLNRLVFPFVPDLKWNRFTNSKKFQLSVTGGLQYSNNSSVFERGVQIIGDCMVQENCTISKNVYLENCVIGRGTTIAEGSTIKNSIIGENVNIGQACQISEAFVFGNSELRNNSHVVRSVLSYNVVVDEEVTINDFSLIHNNSSILHRRRKLFSYSSEGSIQKALRDNNRAASPVCGSNGLGYMFHLPVDDDEEELKEHEEFIEGVGYVPDWAKECSNKYNVKLILAMSSKLEQIKHKRFSDFSDIDSEEEKEDFDIDVNAGFIRGINDLINVENPDENLRLEVSCFKYAEHRTSAECFAVVFSLVFEPVLSLPSDKVISSFKSRLSKWAHFFALFMLEDGCQNIALDCLEVLFYFDSSAVTVACLEVVSRNYDVLDQFEHSTRQLQMKFPFALGATLTVLDDIDVQGWLDHRESVPLKKTLLQLELSQRVFEAQLEDSEEYDEEYDEESD